MKAYMLDFLKALQSAKERLEQYASKLHIQELPLSFTVYIYINKTKYCSKKRSYPCVMQKQNCICLLLFNSNVKFLFHN